MESAEMFRCKWSSCPDTFTSELDMGLHVMRSHLNVLDYGHFVWERRPNGSVQGIAAPVEVITANLPAASAQRRPTQRSSGRFTASANSSASVAAPTPRPPRSARKSVPARIQALSSEIATRPARVRGIWSRNQTADDRAFAQLAQMIPARPPPIHADSEESDAPDDPEEPESEEAPANRTRTPRRSTSGDLPMSEAARSLLRRLRLPPKHMERLFQTEHFCIPCQVNCTSPCKKTHRPQDLEVVAEWKRQYGHLKPTKKALLSQIREMIDQYDEAERGGATSSLSEQRSNRKRESEAPVASEVVPTSSMRMEIKQEEVRDVEVEDDDSETPERVLHSVRSSSIRRNPEKISKVCSALIFRVRTRYPSFRTADRSKFCLNCLSFSPCLKVHTLPERKLAKRWLKTFGKEHISAESLVDQLEQLKRKYVQKERDAE